jgi:hypothetical protein
MSGRILGLSPVLAILLACTTAAPGIMTFEAYRRTEHPTPYIIQLSVPRGSLLYYGAAHVYDATHPQILDIQRRWAQFKPTYALNEGGTPPVLDTVEETVGRNGEAGLVRWLAKQDAIPVETLDPTNAQLLAASAERFTPEEFKLSSVLRQVSQQNRRSEQFRASDLEAEVSRVPGMEGPPRTVAELETSTTKLLPMLTNWRAVPAEWFDPAIDPPTWLNDLARFTSDYRDDFMLQRVITKLEQGHRVFAVVGATHVVMQERAVRWRIRRLH